MVLLKLSLLASILSFISAILLCWACLHLEARFRLVAFISFSCAMTYPYRVHLMSVALGSARDWSMRNGIVQIVYVLSSLGSTWLYTGLAFNILHTYLALTRVHRYDSKRMSLLFIILSVCIGLGNCIVRIVFLSEGLQKNHVNYINLLALLAICITGAPVLVYLALRTWRARRASHALPSFSTIDARSAFDQWMVLRFLLIALILLVGSCTNLMVLTSEMVDRRFQPIELGSAPRAEDLVNRYGAAAWTGTLLLFVYCTGKEVGTFFTRFFLYRK